MATNSVQKIPSTDKGMGGLSGLLQGVEGVWKGRNVKILIGSWAAGLGFVLMVVSAAALSSLWPLAIVVMAVGAGILVYAARVHKEDPSELSELHIQLPPPEMLALQEKARRKEAETVQNSPASTAAAPEENPLSLSSADGWLTASNALQWGVLAASLYGVDPAMTTSIATAANIGMGFATRSLLPKDASWIRQALSIPFIYQKIIGFHPAVKGLAQLHSLYTLAQRSRSMLSAAWSQRTSHPVNALKVGGVQLFNLLSGLAFAADNAGLIALSPKAAEPAKPAEPEPIVSPAPEPAVVAPSPPPSEPAVVVPASSPEPAAPAPSPQPPEPIVLAPASSPEPAAPVPSPTAPLEPANSSSPPQQSWLGWGWDWTYWALFGSQPAPEPDRCQCQERQRLNFAEWWPLFWYYYAITPGWTSVFFEPSPAPGSPSEQSWFDWLRGASAVGSSPAPEPPPGQSWFDWLRGAPLPVKPREPSWGEQFVNQVGLGWWFGAAPQPGPSAIQSTVQSWVERSPLGWWLGAAPKPAPVPAAPPLAPAPLPSQPPAAVQTVSPPPAAVCPPAPVCPQAAPCPVEPPVLSLPDPDPNLNLMFPT